MVGKLQLTTIALEHIKFHHPGIKQELALALDCSEGSINRYIRENDDNLTKAACLLVLRKRTGLPYSKILERAKIRSKT